MSVDQPRQPRPAIPRMLARRDVLAGALFCAVALLGLYVSRNYPVGTALRMGTGYVPRLLCWVLLALGAVILARGLRQIESGATAQVLSGGSAWRSLVFVTASLMIFALTIERLGMVLSVLLLVGVGAFAARGLRPLETFVAAVVLILLSWSIFIAGLGLAIPVWPEW
jgi:putative tricarboxylic transport membrane protein